MSLKINRKYIYYQISKGSFHSSGYLFKVKTISTTSILSNIIIPDSYATYYMVHPNFEKVSITSFLEKLKIVLIHLRLKKNNSGFIMIY